MVSDSFSATLGVLLRNSNTSGDTLGSEPRRGVPPVRAEFDYNPPSDDEYAELGAAIDELDRTLVLFDAGQEARRMAIRMMVDFFGRRQSTKPPRSISAALEGDTTKQPETYQYDKEPFDYVDRPGRVVEQAPSVAPLQLNHGATYEGGNFDVTGGIYSNNGWTSISGEAHGNGSFSISGGVCGNGLVDVSRQKRPAHRPPDPDLPARDAEIVQEFRKMMAKDPKPLKKEIHIELGRRYHLSQSSIRTIVKGA